MMERTPNTAPDRTRSALAAWFRRFRHSPAFTGFVLFAASLLLNVVVLLISTITTGKPFTFFTLKSINDLVMPNTQFLLVCMAQGLLLIAGTMDLSIGIQLALVNVVCIYTSNILGVPVPVSWLFGILAAVAASLVCGLGCSILRLPALLVGYAMIFIVKGVNTLVLKNAFGKVPKEFYKPYQNLINGFISIPILIILAVFLFWVYLKRTRFGRYIYAVGDNPRNAFAAGINPTSVQMGAFVIKGFITGIAGVCLTLMLASGNPIQAEDYGLRSLSACIIGGMGFGGWGSLSCALFGGSFLVLIQNAVNNVFILLPKLIKGFKVQSFWQNFIVDVIFLMGLFLTLLTAKEHRAALKQGALKQLKRGEKHAKR